MTKKWTEKHFTRRKYTIDSPALDKARNIRVTVHVDGQKLVEMQAREPGLLAIVSRPDQDGFNIDVAEVSLEGVRFTDIRTPNGESTMPLAQWQQMALFGDD